MLSIPKPWSLSYLPKIYCALFFRMATCPQEGAAPWQRNRSPVLTSTMVPTSALEAQ